MPEVAAQLDGLWSRGIVEGKATPMDHQPFYLRNGDRLEEQIFNVNMLPIIDSHGKTVGFYEASLQARKSQALLILSSALNRNHNRLSQ
jgi:hypothetical protein